MGGGEPMGDMRRAAQEEYYNILADTAIAVDLELSKPGPRALIRRERDRRQFEEIERREEAAAEREARKVAAAAEAASRAASSKPRRGAPNKQAAGGGRPPSGNSEQNASRPTTPLNPPGSPGEESSHSFSHGHGHATHHATRPSRVGKDDAPKDDAGVAQPRVSASIQRQKLELRVSAFDEMRRETNKGLRQELDRFSDERMERFRRKLTALDVRKLAKPGFQNPHREMQKVRDRAEQMAEEEA